MHVPSGGREGESSVIQSASSSERSSALPGAISRHCAPLPWRASSRRSARSRCLAELALEFYGPESVGPGRATPGERWIAFQSDRIFHWPAARLADAHARSRGATYTYLFRWQPPLLRSRLGACHGLEIPFVFGTLRAPMLRSTIGVARSARLLSDRMQDAWIAFARSGNPAHAGLPDWPRYENGRHATMLLGNTCRAEPSRFDGVHSFWERATADRDGALAAARVSRASA